MAAQTPDTYLYLTDAEGRKTHIVLTLEES